MTKIMLVEDDKSLREIYGIRLIAEGYEIKSANDGEQALAMAIKERPDLIISDVMMPKISGFDMLDILRATPETKDIKVIMMTALSSDDQRARGESLGANRYLVKSQVGIEDVVRTVHDVLADAPIAAPAAVSFGSLAPTSTTTTIQPAQPTSAPAPTNPMPEPQPVVTAPTPAPVVNDFSMPQPTAPFSSPAPASLGDSMTRPTAPTPISVQSIPVTTPQPAPQEPVVNVEPTPVINTAPMPAPVFVTPTATPQTPQQPMPAGQPIQDIVPQQSQPQTQPDLSNIADLIAKELGGSQPTTPQTPAQ